MFAYLFERFPKFSQTFCYREVQEVFRQGRRPPIFSLRPCDPNEVISPEVMSNVHALPEADLFALRADEAAEQLEKPARKLLRAWRGKPDSLRLHQATYIGVRLRQLGIAHLHAHFAGMAARTAFWISKLFGINYSLTVHANDIFAPRQFDLGLSELLGCAKAIVAVSDFAADHLRNRFPGLSDRVHRVYNGVDLDGFQASRFSEPPLILAIGRLISKKGFDVLIDACALRAKDDFRCEIIGDGPLRDELQRRISNAGLSSRLCLAGAKPSAEIAGRLSEATVLVLPSRVDADGSMDNLPTVIMEAMAASLPVVSTEVGGIREMVRHNETGFTVPQNAPEATAEALRRLITDKELARKMGEMGRDRAAELFSISQNAGKLLKIIDR